MSINTYFNDFLSKIRLTPTQKDESKRGHETLRDRLRGFDELKDIYVSDFLQGSYRRSTAVRPQGEKRSDVDIIVVTNLDRSKVTPHEALQKFEPFAEKYYKGKWKPQGRSIGIELSYVDLDIVVTSAPSEVDETILKSLSVTTEMNLEDLSSRNYDWKLSKSWIEPDLMKANNYLSEAVRAEAEWKTAPLWIPDRDAGTWETTHPLEQIKWTTAKNKKTNGLYINVVKALKWWRIVKLADLKYPKGYPVEHVIGDCCPDDITSLAEGVTRTLETFVSNYSANRLLGVVPTFSDRGVPEHNVWKRITVADFNKFYDTAKAYAKIAREGINEPSLRLQTEKWREVFGDKFPMAPDDDDNNGNDNGPLPSGGFTKKSGDTDIKPTRFA